ALRLPREVTKIQARNVVLPSPSPLPPRISRADSMHHLHAASQRGQGTNGDPCVGIPFLKVARYCRGGIYVLMHFREKRLVEDADKLLGCDRPRDASATKSHLDALHNCFLRHVVCMEPFATVPYQLVLESLAFLWC